MFVFGGVSFDENDVYVFDRLQIVGHILNAAVFRVSYTEKFYVFFSMIYEKLFKSLTDRIT